MGKYLFQLSMVALIAFCLGLLILNLLPIQWTIGIKTISFIAIFYFLLNLSLHLLLVKIPGSDHSGFVRSFLLFTALKLMALLGVIVSVFFLFPDKGMHFALFFAGNYLVFTGFEVTTLYRKQG